MKKESLLMAMSLLISLYIYVFYRTERTLVNELVVRLISVQVYSHVKAIVSQSLPISDIMIYSMPEGLWIFCITLTSKPYYVRLFSQHIDCLYIPLIFCLTLEILQLFHVTNGRFDFMDILVFVLFWLLGRYTFSNSCKKQDILSSLDAKTLFCLASYGIVYFAHVFK